MTNEVNSQSMNRTIIISITPIDTLFFKDGKPFSMGDDTWADGIFPPSPSTIYGALRTLYFSENPSELSEIEKNDPTNNLVIEKIYLENLEEYDSKLFPSPLDMFLKENETLDFFNIRKNNFCSSIKNKVDSILITNDSNISSLENNLIKDIECYLEKKDSYPFKSSDINSFISKEAKTGIAINNETNSIDEGKLYRVGMNRLKDISFVVEFKGINFPDNFFDEPKIIKLGAEGKTAFCKKIDLPNFNQNISINSKNIKMYLSTPAIFDNGWIPDFIDKEKMTGNLKISGQDVELELKTAVIGKPIMIGGFDMLNNKPKQMKKAVPSGSVYYFASKENINSTDLISFSICKGDYRKQGFGIVFLGVY